MGGGPNFAGDANVRLFVGSLATMQRKLILYRENILGCQRNNPQGNVSPSLPSGGLFYPHCVRVKHLQLGKTTFPLCFFSGCQNFSTIQERLFLEGAAADFSIFKILRKAKPYSLLCSTTLGTLISVRIHLLIFAYLSCPYSLIRDRTCNGRYE